MNREYNENSEYNLNEEINLDLETIVINRIIKVNKTNKETKLTNLEVSTNRNFVTPIGIAHNGGKRKGSFAVYLEPWHADVFEFIDLRKNHGKEEMRARDLFLAMWTPNLFMKRVEEDGDWSLFSPDEAPGLSDVYDDPFNFTQNFTELYEKYEKEGKARKVIKARKLMDAILTAQIETGTPYMLYKDPANYKSNQKNLGTIKSSNLCTEIIEYSSPTEQAVCNLASIALPKYIIDGKFCHQTLYDYTYQVVKNLNNVIDLNFYPTEETKISNFKHRPVGLGVQGLADVFCLLHLPFESEESDILQTEIFETIYFAALTSSKDLAKVNGPYESIKESPIENGIFQYEMWGKTDNDLSGRWDWDSLRKEVIVNGVRNSLLVAPMPTASCFVSNGKIQTNDGIKTYRQIMDENGIDWESIEKTGNQSWLNFENSIMVNTRFGFKETNKIFYNGHVETLKIEMEDGEIFECSYNHKFLVNREGEEKWVRADELKEDDDIVTI